MTCTNLTEKGADVCVLCGQEICSDSSILINNKVTCQACIEKEINVLTTTHKFKTLKETSRPSRSLDVDVAMYPDVATGMLLTIILIMATLFVCLDASLNPYTPYVALMTLLFLVAVVYDINKVINKA